MLGASFYVLTSFDISTRETTVSWYGPGFDGRVTANGEIFYEDSLTCASPSLRFNTKLLVTNPNNGKSVIIRVNDRGPYKMDKEGKAIFPLIPHPVREFDLSKAAFNSIADLDKGLLKIQYKIIK